MKGVNIAGMAEPEVEEQKRGRKRKPKPSEIILEKIEEEGVIKYKCPFDETVQAMPGILSHMRLKHGYTLEQDEESGEMIAKPAPKKRMDLSKLTPREIVVLYGEEGLEKLKREKLLDFLHSAPGVSDKIIHWVAKIWDTDLNVRKDPNALFSALRQSGVKDHIAYRIVNALVAIEAEFRPLLEQPPVFTPYASAKEDVAPYWSQAPPRAPSAPYWPKPSETRPPSYAPPAPYGGPPSSTYVREGISREEVRSIVMSEISKLKSDVISGVNEILEKRDKEAREDRLVRALESITSRIEGLSARVTKLEEKPEEPSIKEVMEEFGEKIESLGKSMKESTESVIERYIKEHQREERMEKRFAEMMERSDKRFAEVIGEIKKIPALGPKVVEGYREDSYRLIGQGISEIARIASERKPVEVVVRTLAGAPEKIVPRKVEEESVAGIPSEYVVEE